MGKTHEDSVRELAAKTPYKVGIVQDKIMLFKTPLLNLLVMLAEPAKHGTLEKLQIANEFRKVIPLLDEFPEPTLETCKYQNSRHLVKIRDEFFKHVKFKARDKALRAIINFIIIIYEYDEPYRFLIDWWFEELLEIVKEGAWLPRGAWLPGNKIHYTWWMENPN
jgi:hypothetical protein